mgnify:CR=1 FL=1
MIILILHSSAPSGLSAVSRNHFAAYLSAGGYVENRYEAFDRYLGKGRPCYIPLHRIKAYDAVKIILSAHGLPVAAHPVRYRLDENGYIRMFTMLKSFGLRGIEALYSDNTYEDESMLTKLASQLGLFITGGSGFHGSYKPEIELGTGRGNLMVPQELLDEMIRSR